ncbi:MAG: DUF1295 domain-containing protein [Planctomycetes bacterium]|nr:DUF1295 domain-containing protein [Planctomycetota bacterium]
MPEASNLTPEPAPAPERPPEASPFADPNYGRDAEEGEYVIASKPHWPMAETQSPLTGWVGAAVVLAGALLLAGCHEAPRLPESLSALDQTVQTLWYWRHSLIILFIFFAMFFVETVVLKTHRRHFDFEHPRAVDQAAWRRIGLRWLATLFCVGAATFLYCFLGEYNFTRFDLYGVLVEGKSMDQVKGHFYGRYILFYIVAMPTLLAACIPYYWLVERHARHNGPTDEFLVLGYALRRIAWWFNTGFFNPEARADARRALANPHVANLFRGLFVKFFYVPLMLLWTFNLWNDWEHVSHSFLALSGSANELDAGQTLQAYFAFHHMYFTFLILLDLSSALAGYCISMRLLDTHITTAEPTLFGWTMALACYPPFNSTISGIYLPYDTPNVVVWQTRLNGNPTLVVAASVLMLGLMTIYTWGTLAFGLRFSNLTNRGLVCNGPYRYIRHPAYICKNLAWWIEYMPFTSPNLLDAVIRSVHLLMVNLIYGLRAYTEERHLMREAHYREYCRKVPWRFIPGIF